MEWRTFECTEFSLDHEIMGQVYIRIELETRPEPPPTIKNRTVATGKAYCSKFPKAVGYRGWTYPTLEEARREVESWTESLVAMCLESVDASYNLREVMAHNREQEHRIFMTAYAMRQASLFD
jgi:hypothetical protein